MRQIGEIMEDLGFNKDSDLETQKAFVQYLVKSAKQNEQKFSTLKPRPTEPKVCKPSEPTPNEPEQLSFDILLWRAL